MFQILKNSRELEFEYVDKITKKTKQFNNKLSIIATKEDKEETEEKTTSEIVLNPNSEWIK